MTARKNGQFFILAILKKGHLKVDPLALFKINSFQKILSILNSEQTRCSVGPDLGPNCLQTFSAFGATLHQ